MILAMNRNELICDLPRAFREQNDLAAMTDKALIALWKRQGTHAGTWDWDDVEITEV